MADPDNGDVRLCGDLSDRLRVGEGVSPRLAEVWLALSHVLRLGPGQRAVWGFAVHLWDTGLLDDRSDNRRAAKHRYRGLPDGDCAFLDSAGAHHLNRIAGRGAEHHSWTMGNEDYGSGVLGAPLSVVTRSIWISSFVQRPDLWRRHFIGWYDSGHYDPAHHYFGIP